MKKITNILFYLKRMYWNQNYINQYKNPSGKFTSTYNLQYLKCSKSKYKNYICICIQYKWNAVS